MAAPKQQGTSAQAQQPAAGDGNGANGDGGWGNQLVTMFVSKAIPAIATTLGLAGFVALIGAAVMWRRLEAAQLPTSVLSVVPQDRFIPMGAASIIGFLLLGAAGTLLVYGLDYGTRRDGAASGGSTRQPEPLPLTLGASAAITVLVGVELLAALVAFKPDLVWLLSTGFLIVATTGLVVLFLVRSAAPQSRSDSRQIVKWSKAKDLIVPSREVWWVGGTVASAIAVTVLIGFPVYEHKGRALVVVPVAIGLGLACLGAARARKFFWFGVCVFATVGLFGMLITFLRTGRNPKVEPAVVLRHDAPPICAYFITETDDRLYLARNTLKEHDTKYATGGSGYVFSLPKAHTAKSIGAPITMDRARVRMPVMLAALERDFPKRKPAKQPKSGWCASD